MPKNPHRGYAAFFTSSSTTFGYISTTAPLALYPYQWPSPADGPYIFSIDYTDPNGQADLKNVYLQLRNGNGGPDQTMMWGLSGEPAQWAGEGSHLRELSASKQGITNGYRVDWSFKMDDSWTPSPAVDFRAWARDDHDVDGPAAGYDSNRPYDNGLLIWDARVDLVADHNQNGYYSELNIEWDADTSLPSRNICVAVYADDVVHIERYIGQHCYTIHGNAEDWHSFAVDVGPHNLERATWDFRLQLYDASDNFVWQRGAGDDSNLNDVPIETTAQDEPFPVSIRLDYEPYVEELTATAGVLIRLRAFLCQFCAEGIGVGDEAVRFEQRINGSWIRIPEDGVSLTNNVTDSFGRASVYFLPDEDLLSVHVRAVHDRSNRYAASASTPINVTIEKRLWHFRRESSGAPSRQKIPLVLIHGNDMEDATDSGWSEFIIQFATDSAVMDITDRFDVYNWIHDSRAAIGFNGSTGNARDLANFIYGPANNGLLSLYDRRKVLLVAHSRGGLVARSFMNYNHQGEDVVGLITLGTPHHGSPFAVPDWAAITWVDVYGGSEFCFNLLDNTDGPFIAFDVDRLGSLNLAWDNLDGKIAGRTLTQFDVDIAQGGFVDLTIGDENSPRVDADDSTTFFGSEYKPKFGTLAELNANEPYFDKIVAFAAYDDNIADNSDWLLDLCGLSAAEAETAGVLPDDHEKLEMVTPLLAAMGDSIGGTASYHANDGLVPLQSALFLDISDAVPFTQDEDLPSVTLLPEEIADRMQVRTQHVFSGDRHIVFRSDRSIETVRSDFNVRDHLDLLDTTNDSYWATLKGEILSFVDTHAPSVQAWSERSFAYEGCRITLASSATDPDGDAMTFAWSQVGGKIVSWETATNQRNVSFRVPAYYSGNDSRANTQLSFEVTVSDGNSAPVNRPVMVRSYLAGDATHDFTVSGADFTLWKANNGSSAAENVADFDCSGSAAGADFTIWKANNGRSFP